MNINQPYKHSYPRIYVEWSEPGVWMNSVGTEFQKLLEETVEKYGPPDVIEYRDD